MSELKTYKMVDEKYCTDCLCVIPSDVYLKSEADKVIAELKDKALQYKVLYKELCRDINTQERHFARQIAHQKYKRCLAMADMCSEALCYWDNVKYTFFKGEAYCFRKMNHYGKWGQIWLAIAEKFRELK